MKRTRPALALALAGVLALSACGDDGDDEAVDPSTTASASPSQDPTVCPSSAMPVEPFAGVVEANQDTTTKPKVVKGPQPGPTDLTYFDIVEGSGPEVRVGSEVKLKYVGVLYDTGKEFDSSWSRGVDETFDIKACYPGAIVGFSVGPIGMKLGGRRQINIPSKDFGYGEAGSPPAVPKNTDLIFVVDAVSVDGDPPATPAPATPTATPPTTGAPAAPAPSEPATSTPVTPAR